MALMQNPYLKLDSKDNSLGISWHDSTWIPNLNPGNVIDYFSERSNPFYDRTCNNEIVKMQRLNPEQLNNMTGLEYILLHCQEPILYVVRKQHRHSPAQVTPLADYYIIAGVVYQAPDIGSIINSRILSAVHHIQTAFDKTQSYSRYHPSKGYWWDFKDEGIDATKKSKEKGKDEPSSLFQRQRVDVLLGELAKKYPPKVLPPPPHQMEKAVATAGAVAAAAAAAPPLPPPPTATSVAASTVATAATTATQPAAEEPPNPVAEVKQEIKVEIKTEPMTPCSNAVVSGGSTGSQPPPPSSSKAAVKPPLEKRPRLA